MTVRRLTIEIDSEDARCGDCGYAANINAPTDPVTEIWICELFDDGSDEDTRGRLLRTSKCLAAEVRP